MRKGMWGWWCLLAGLWLAVANVAGAVPKSVRDRVESSLLVKGSVDIEPDGSVSAVAIDHEDKLPAGVVKFVRDSGLQWKFEPVVRDGRAVRARTAMSVRVVAKKLEGDDYRISLRGASFGRYDEGDLEQVVRVRTPPPGYPDRAARMGASGNVYLVLKVGRDGQVQDVIAEQVNLRELGSEGELRVLRETFSRSAVTAAKSWTFRPPSAGPSADAPFWTVRVPVRYAFQGLVDEDKDYGKWMTYVAGDRQPIPWAHEQEGPGFSPDTLADGGVYLADGRAPKLLTPLQGG